MERELNNVGMAAAMRAFYKGPPGVVRKVQNVDSYPGERVAPDDPTDPEAYQPIRTTISDEHAAIGDAVRAYLDCMGLKELGDRWVAFSKEELEEIASLVLATEESYDLTADSKRLRAEVEAELEARRA